MAKDQYILWAALSAALIMLLCEEVRADGLSVQLNSTSFAKPSITLDNNKSVQGII